MELTLIAGCWKNFVNSWQKRYSSIITTACFINLPIGRYNDQLLPFLRQFLLIELISLWISKQTVLPPALSNSAGILSIPGDLCLFSQLKPKALGSGTSGSAVYISACLKSLTLHTFNSWEKWFLHVAKILRQTTEVCQWTYINMQHSEAL